MSYLDQSTTSHYLEEAAAQLRKVAENIDKDAAATRAMSSIHGHYNDERHKLAEAFGALAAIERGLIPADMAGDILAQALTRAAAR